MALRDSLVSWWELNETGGTREDAHGSYDLTDYNTVGYGTGKQGNCADLEASNSEYFARSSDCLGLSATGDLSIGFWIKFETSGATPQNFFSFNIQNGSDDKQLSADIGVAGSNIVRFMEGNEVGSITNASWTPTVGTWYYISFTYKYNTASTGMNFYVNGVLIASGSSTSTYVSGTVASFTLGALTFGSGLPPYGRYIDGLLDEVGVWSRVLSQAEIYQLYNGGAGIPYSATSTFIPRVSFIM